MLLLLLLLSLLFHTISIIFYLFSSSSSSSCLLFPSPLFIPIVPLSVFLLSSLSPPTAHHFIPHPLPFYYSFCFILIIFLYLPFHLRLSTLHAAVPPIFYPLHLYFILLFPSHAVSPNFLTPSHPLFSSSSFFLSLFSSPSSFSFPLFLLHLFVQVLPLERPPFTPPSFLPQFHLLLPNPSPRYPPVSFPWFLSLSLSLP